ncbi:endonuclease/exonuclease/phosphatase family protein [Erwinia aphidicola]|uniref:endonuclease/exonuclease/phosphatase family protein n=1 Tax=Erwinia aphidicola TaxID=68334 RepID=UPI0030CD116E
MRKYGRVTIAWWNTSLSPHSKEGKASDAHKQYVSVIFARLLNEMAVDILCLCEVSPLDIQYITEAVGDKFFVYNGAFKDGKKKFDLCVIFRLGVVKYIESSVVSKPHPSGAKIYAGQRIELRLVETNEVLTLFLVHWSSRMYDYEDSPQKSELGMLLQSAVADCLHDEEKSKVIVLGDFNEEPFNNSITYHLGASRDIALVKKRTYMLYNPFWRHLVYSKMHPDSDTTAIHGGTYYYKGDKFSKWKTFDQMMFSSDFVNGKRWHLNENETVVFSDPQFINYINSSKSKFDHLPIISVIERMNNE